jgi:hypothetical protein
MCSLDSARHDLFVVQVGRLVSSSQMYMPINALGRNSTIRCPAAEMITW